MSGNLDGFDTGSALDPGGRSREAWIRRGLVCVLILVPVLGLFNVFGQRATSAKNVSTVASLTVHSPTRVRSGLLFEAKFTIIAKQQIKQATLNLGGGWANGLTINTIEPSPTDETSDNGNLSFQLGSIDAGKSFVLHMQFQVNPTTYGTRHQQVALADGDLTLASIDRTLTVIP